MRGLITHEESQEVMMAFNKLPGRYFYSNDLKPPSGGMPSMHANQAIEAIRKQGYMREYPGAWFTEKFPEAATGFIPTINVYRYRLIKLN